MQVVNGRNEVTTEASRQGMFLPQLQHHQPKVRKIHPGKERFPSSLTICRVQILPQT